MLNTVARAGSRCVVSCGDGLIFTENVCPCLLSDWPRGCPDLHSGSSLATLVLCRGFLGAWVPAGPQAVMGACCLSDSPSLSHVIRAEWYSRDTLTPVEKMGGNGFGCAP